MNTQPTFAPDNTHSCLNVASRNHVDIIAWANLIRVEAWSNYSRLLLADGRTLVVSRVLKQIEKRLDSHLFIRSHNTHLINMDFLTGMNQTGDLCLANGDCIPVSRRRRACVKRQLNERGTKGEGVTKL